MEQEANPAIRRLMTKAQVREATGMTERQIDNNIRRGTFPRGVALSARQLAWPAHEVQAWIDAKVAERDAGVKTPVRIAYEEARRRGGLKAAHQRKTAAASAAA